MPKFIDLSGKVFGELTVIERAPNLILKSGKPRTQWFCICACGNSTVVSAQSLIQGTTISCGCVGKAHRREKAMGRVKDMTGMVFGRLTVVSRADSMIIPSGQRKTMWNCLCECGNMCIVSRNSLLRGRTRSCGCYKSETTSERKSVDITGVQSGYLTAIERIGTMKHPGSSSSLWLCQCQCGNKTIVPYSHIVNKHTQSCGCVGFSKGEKDIDQWLSLHEIPYSTQKSFDDLQSSKNATLYFDFCIYDLSNNVLGLIEYQGIQHYIVPKSAPEFGARQREETDKLKKEYCASHKIPLYEISCFDDTIKQLEFVIHQLRAKPRNEEGVTTIRKE